MTWLELIDELRRQPLWLLEQEVKVWWDDLDAEECRNVPDMDVVQLVCPTNECEDPTLWTEDSGCSMSLTVMPKPKLNEYMVKIHRVCNVSVMAEDPEQAQRIGENLAGGYTSLACDTINAAMFECDDEFYGVGSVSDERCNLALDEEDSMKVLNGEE